MTVRIDIPKSVVDEAAKNIASLTTDKSFAEGVKTCANISNSLGEITLDLSTPDGREVMVSLAQIALIQLLK